MFRSLRTLLAISLAALLTSSAAAKGDAKKQKTIAEMCKPLAEPPAKTKPEKKRKSASIPAARNLPDHDTIVSEAEKDLEEAENSTDEEIDDGHFDDVPDSEGSLGEMSDGPDPIRIEFYEPARCEDIPEKNPEGKEASELTKEELDAERQKIFLALVTVRYTKDGEEKSRTFRGTTFPNKRARSKKKTFKILEEGEYPGVLRPLTLSRCHKKLAKDEECPKECTYYPQKQAIGLNPDRFEKVPAVHMPKDCSVGEKTKADKIYIHSAESEVNPGSRACLTIDEKDWGDFYTLILRLVREPVDQGGARGRKIVVKINRGGIALTKESGNEEDCLNKQDCASCVIAGHNYYRGENGFPEDRNRALDLLKTGCYGPKAGKSGGACVESCTRLWYNVTTWTEVPEFAYDLNTIAKRIFEMRKQVCNGGKGPPAVCVELAEDYVKLNNETSAAIPVKDIITARGIAGPACNGGNPAACEAMAFTYEDNGDIVPWLDKGCDLDGASACFHLGRRASSGSDLALKGWRGCARLGIAGRDAGRALNHECSWCWRTDVTPDSFPTPLPGFGTTCYNSCCGYVIGEVRGRHRGQNASRRMKIELPEATLSQALWMGDFIKAHELASAQGKKGDVLMAYAQLVEAQKALERKKYGAAQSYFNRAATFAPELERVAAYWVCEMYSRKGNIRRARDCFEEAGPFPERERF